MNSKKSTLLFILFLFQSVLSFGATTPFIAPTHIEFESSSIEDLEQLNIQIFAEIENQIATDNYQRLEKYFNLPQETASINGVAIMGLHGHIFVGGGSNSWENQLFQPTYFPKSHYLEWVSLIQRRKEQALKLGVKLLQIVVPDKQAIIPHLRWKNQPETLDQRPVLQLLTRLNQKDLLYPIQPLLNNAQNFCLYPRENTHWNALGCWLYFKPLLEKIWPSHQFLTKELDISIFTSPGDLLPHLWSENTENLVTRFQAKGTRVYTNNVYPTRHANHCEIWINPNAKVKEHLLIFGNSFIHGSTLAMLTQFVEKITFYWGGISWNVVNALKPDVVLWQTCERFLFIVPTDEWNPSPEEIFVQLSILHAPYAFSPQNYINAYPDLHKYLKKKQMSKLNANSWATNHYINHGIQEGRQFFSTEFDPRLYVALHKDLNSYIQSGKIPEADIDTWATQHYLNFGRKEKRNIR